MAGDFTDGVADIGKNLVRTHHIQSLESGIWAGWRGKGRSNLSREAEFSGANGDLEKFIFPVRLAQDFQLCPVDAQFARIADYTYITMYVWSHI